jgi:hypothetical protein
MAILLEKRLFSPHTIIAMLIFDSQMIDFSRFLDSFLREIVFSIPKRKQLTSLEIDEFELYGLCTAKLFFKIEVG